MSSPSQNNLTDTTLTALRWDYTGTAVRAISSLTIGIVLARLLGPKPFGLVAVAWLVVRLGNLIADMGMGTALIQRKTISEYDLRYIFTIQVCMGVGLTAILSLSAAGVGYIFHQPNVVPVVRALSLIFALQAFGLTALSLLRRQMDFKSIQVAQICSYLVGFLVLGIPLALLGFEVWSLVIAQLSQSALFSALCYLKTRHQIKPLFVPPSTDLFHFGSKVLLTNIVNWTISNIDSFFIGRYFDVVVLGLYSRAQVLVTTPMQNLVTTVQRVMFSSYSRVQNDLKTVQKAYLACIGYLAVLILPAYGCMALVPATVIHGLFGDEWQTAVPFIAPLALSMPFHAMMAMGGPMLWSQNKVGCEFRAQFFTALIFLVVLFVTSWFSVIAMAWGVLGVSILRFVLVTHASLKIVDTPWSSLIRSTRGAMLLLIPTGSIVWCSDLAIAACYSSAILRLTADMVIGVGVLLGTVLISPTRIVSHEMRWFAERLTSRVPVPLQPLMRRVCSPT